MPFFSSFNHSKQSAIKNMCKVKKEAKFGLKSQPEQAIAPLAQPVPNLCSPACVVLTNLLPSLCGAANQPAPQPVA